MKAYMSKKFTHFPCLFAALSMFFFFATAVMADGTGHHHPESAMSEHMQSMMAAKEEIPEDYRIMERTPVLPVEESLQQGQHLFSQNCTVCHGEHGDGKGPAAAAMKTPPANFLDKEHSAIYGPGEKYWIIGHGTKKTGMPAFAQFTPVERWHLVNYILQLQQSVSTESQGHNHHQ